MLFNLFKKKPKEISHTFVNPYNHKEVTFTEYPYTNREEYLVYKLYDWQYDFAKSEIEKVNNALQDNPYTKKLPLQFSDLKYGDYAFNPFTPKGKIKLNPCNLNLYFRTSEGIPYGMTISYDVNDIPKTASYSNPYVFPVGDCYTVVLHYVNNRFYVTKVVKTDSHYNNAKLYHIRKEDINDN